MAKSDSCQFLDSIAGQIAELGDMAPGDVSDYDFTLKNLKHVHAFCSPAEDADDERRQSAMTTTSISSFPESAIMSDDDPVTPILNLYTPRQQRSNLRWPGSAVRGDRASSSPLGSRSPRRTKLAQHSRAGTPRSMGKIDFRGSPKCRRRISEATEVQPEGEDKQYPLILLHVTLLPVRLPWSNDVISELLPADILASVRQLKAKASETILSRGILISHPREEYDLLEERLLEALELQDERVTKCGHFRARSSIGSMSDSDSGIGSSVDGFDNELCAICQHHIRPSRASGGSRQKKWNVRVFAANGLLRPSAWAAAWSDMEAVDVEISPLIDEDLRRLLDAKAIDEEVAQQLEQEQKQEERLRAVVQIQERFLAKESDNQETENAGDDVSGNRNVIRQESLDGYKGQQVHEVPDIYQRSQIPLSLLLRNYLYLLSQDWRNVAIAALSTIAIFLLFQLLAWPANLSALRRNTTAGIPHASPPRFTVRGKLAALENISEDSEKSLLAFEAGHPPAPVPLAQGNDRLLDDTCKVDSTSPLFGTGLDDEICGVS